jgi:hypothetical protein
MSETKTYMQMVVRTLMNEKTISNDTANLLMAGITQMETEFINDGRKGIVAFLATLPYEHTNLTTTLDSDFNALWHIKSYNGTDHQYHVTIKKTRNR